MRIAIVTDSFKPRIGGIESFLEDYIKVLTQKQHEVIVITKAKQNSRAENISPSCFPIFKENGVSVIRLSHSYLDYRGITLNPRAIAMMSGILKAVDPDVVHEHSLYSTLALVGAYSSWKRLGRPSVLTAHSFLDKDTPSYIVLGLRFLVKNTGVLTAVSRSLAEELYRRLKPPWLTVTYNCLVCSEWAKAEEDSSLEGDPVVVSVLRLTHRKNPLALLYLAEEMAREVPKARLYVVGAGELQKAMEKRIKKKGLQNVVLLGPLERSKVRKVLKRSQVFVLPSRTEAFGLSALEAMASGVPVVAMRVGGLPEVISHGESGLLASSLQEFVKYTMVLINDESLRKKLAVGALQRATYFDCEHQLPRYLSVYRFAEKVLAEVK
ncbi:MAG: glycosyltransferase family 4 protein [Acidilobaceae archaeon]